MDVNSLSTRSSNSREYEQARRKTGAYPLTFPYRKGVGRYLIWIAPLCLKGTSSPVYAARRSDISCIRARGGVAAGDQAGTFYESLRLKRGGRNYLSMEYASRHNLWA